MVSKCPVNEVIHETGKRIVDFKVTHDDMSGGGLEGITFYMFSVKKTDETEGTIIIR